MPTPAPFHSILFPRTESTGGVTEREQPECFPDVNLDQVVGAVTSGRDEYNLAPLFHVPLRSTEAITYRHEIFTDLEDDTLFSSMTVFAETMRTMRKQLQQVRELRYRYQKQAWFVDAVQTYCLAVHALDRDLAAANPRSAGLRAFAGYVHHYARSDRFTAVEQEAASVKDALAHVRYALLIRGGRIKVSRYSDEPDYSAIVLDTFEKFAQGSAKDYRTKFTQRVDMNHVEAAVLELVAKLFPDEFGALDTFCRRHQDFLDPTIGAFDREVQFYVAYLDYVARFTAAGLKFCYPEVSAESKQVHAAETFDLALATSLLDEHDPVVCNDFYLEDPERVIVVSGPNQGGKTTFARTFGQLHYLASLGCLVPGREARLFLPDQIYTHFEKQEDITNLRGKLEDDLVRIHDILGRATTRSVIIFNEAFTSTTLEDAVLLGSETLRRIIGLEALCVCVTFIDELASLSDTTVSMVSTVVPEDPATRTFKIVRRPADGRAYAVTIAEKYGLTYERITERIPS